MADDGVDEPTVERPGATTGASSDDSTGDGSDDGQSTRGADEPVRVIVVGYDAWTEPVLEELRARGDDVTVVVTDEAPAARLRDRGFEAVHTDDVDEACFAAAGLEDADAVLVATLDEQRNVLAVLTVMNADESARVATFAREQSDVSKLRAAGADTVVGLGQVVGELLVEVALGDRSVEAVVDELTTRV